tara:strand:+ start:294 stop:458 length:165 start_codon:yes stop_codon:yes gene_type:complete
MNLKAAIKNGQLDQFIAQHEGETGDADAFEATLRSMAGMSKEAREASSRDQSDD